MDEISLALNPPRFVKQRRKRTPLPPRGSSPVWPVPALNGRAPVVLAPPRENRRGVELAYARVAPSDAVATCPPGTPNGTDTHVLPPMTPALASHDGIILFAGRLANGYGLIVDHGNGWASHYANLEALCAIRTDLYTPRDQHVRAGDVIGYVGSPEAGAFKRLYFELWQRDEARQFVPVDARSQLADWRVVEHFNHFTPAPPGARQEAA